jgi:hypothetical protein
VISHHSSLETTSGLARSASASEGVVTAGRKENGRDGDQDLPPEYSVSPDNVR